MIVTPVDPLTLASEDFVRLRIPGLWDGLTVSRIEFRDGRAFWRAYRIANARRPDGPLWFVPHDDENAAFEAAVGAVRSWGGVLIAVEEARSVNAPDTRENGDVALGLPIDPNRNFRDDQPDYAGAMLADLGDPARMIIALHTNAPGFGAGASSPQCPPDDAGGRGEISILVCNDTYRPRRSVRRDWPFDDTDSVAIVPYRRGGAPYDAFCARRLVAADMNVQFERVVSSDGSLSNYAVTRRLPYLNLETRDRGSDAYGMADARNRMTRMIDLVMMQCASIAGVELRAPPPAIPRKPARRRRR
ncbi:hypothetical protein [uncultured Sphingomonas sp.]|uniref:hypothetical protein n=1 Tax=uncultured Sphingomonas sp. TaxID=158754 RepID=UPI0035CC6AC1